MLSPIARVRGGARRALDRFPEHQHRRVGYPFESASEIAVKIVRAAAPGFASLREVIFCCFSRHDLEVYARLLK